MSKKWNRSLSTGKKEQKIETPRDRGPKNVGGLAAKNAYQSWTPGFVAVGNYGRSFSAKKFRGRRAPCSLSGRRHRNKYTSKGKRDA